ncbi:alpha-ketoglutarate-dependent dioxygenase AlkB [Phenylobacterium sp. J426]|uniref:alpha-ketoglutarate-dependent dioxygenase AlkB n=1 Tax=Phenylobacterium sp. J426 TaxID=2898439 RepID=UPI0021512F5B|nr:alpha-ketoglutarate-dependent dioxygenase AlkB [Phenylobacterium sp. J426]MCR5874247.1 alpha-ketoglutarate-dependent dioxygenase AlkB [Phenylobacterium sp. J426]
MANLAQQSLFDPPAPAAPEGFGFQADFVTPVEEAALLARLADLPFEPFQFRGYEGRRRVCSFGWKYDFTGPGLVEAQPLPGWLLPVRDRAAAFAGLPPDAFQHLLINEYQAGAPIGWHKDRPVFDKVVGVSLGAPAVMRFRRRAGVKFERLNAPLPPRSAYLLDGPARTEWEHSLPEAKALRYSLTFRNLR